MTHALLATKFQPLTLRLQSNFPVSKITIGLDLQDLALKFYFSMNLFSLSVTDTGNKKSPAQKA